MQDKQGQDRVAALLDQFSVSHGKVIDLSLRASYLDLLRALGSPHEHLPPCVLVAGTNGKGSTSAFLRALAQEAGLRVHVYTSPHLLRFNERIRLAGDLIGTDELLDLLSEVARLAAPGAISPFEATTAAALAAFARTPADLAILEVGLGGRYDATNVVAHPLASLIARISYDHRDFLGDSLAGIAGEKAGIMRPGTPCYAAFQPAKEARDRLIEEAATLGAPLHFGGSSWRVQEQDNGTFLFEDKARRFSLPRPALLGAHQILNAGLALAATAALPFTLSEESAGRAMRSVTWPARLQPLTGGPLAALLPEGSELWLDGGHNDSAGEVLAAQMRAWHETDARPLHLIYGMLQTKVPAEFLGPMNGLLASLQTLTIAGEALSFSAPDLAQKAREAGFAFAAPAPDLQTALRTLKAQGPCRVLICGSLYLAGNVLAANEQ